VFINKPNKKLFASDQEIDTNYYLETQDIFYNIETTNFKKMFIDVNDDFKITYIN
jgi:hypothetical protein